MDNDEDLQTIDRSKITLTRSLGLTTGILMVASMVIGSGAFKKIAPMSAVLMSKEYILLAWILAGVISILGAFTVSGYSSLTTDSGGIYEYLRITFGNLFSFLYGWASFTILGSGGIAAVAFIFAQSVNYIAPLPNPFSAWENVSLAHYIFPFESSGVKLLAVATVVCLTWINILGTRKGGILNNVVTIAKIAGIIILIVMGLCYSSPAVSEPVKHVTAAPQNTNIFSAIIVAMMSAFWAYDGWYCFGFLSGEIKNPKKNVPVSVITGIGICMLLYVVLNYAFMHVLPLSTLAGISENDIAGLQVARVLSGNTGAVFIALLIVISTFGALNAIVIAYPRLYYRMAQERFFPKHASYVHPRYRTPYVALIYSMVWSCLMIVTGTFDILTNIVIIVEFLFFALLGWGLIKMKRAGKISGNLILYPLSPIVLILFSLGLVINSLMVQPMQSLMGLLFTLSGVPIYYYYQSKNKLHKAQQDHKNAIKTNAV